LGYITVGRENSASIDLYYEDHGTGTPVVLIHGYPLSSSSWEKQVLVLLNAGFRVITYDRRGFGASSRPSVGYDSDTLTRDLHILLRTLDLRETILVGFALGTGEVVRYVGTYGSDRVSHVILLAPLQPFLLKMADNPQGIDGSVFDGMRKALLADRPAYLMAFLEQYYNVDILGGIRISVPGVQLSWTQAIGASARATLACIQAWLTDFRHDLPRIDVPVLVMQGDQDRILPYSATGERLPGRIKNVHFVIIEGGPHAICWTHAEEVNRALLDFLGR
jgi:non-heme chloroperoxidase